MNIIDVPEVEPYDEINPPEYNTIDFADRLLTCLIKRESALIHAEYRSDDSPVTWFICPRFDVSGESDEPIAVNISRDEFRNTLARFGFHYMNVQLYGGFSRCLLRQNDKVCRCSIYMSNEGLSGFWIRIYGAPHNNAA
jgi:hypothetical protein